MHVPPRLHPMERALAERLPHLRGPQRRGLALWVLGAVLAHSACQAAVLAHSACQAAVLAHSACQAAVLAHSACQAAVLAHSACQAAVLAHSACQAAVLAALLPWAPYHALRQRLREWLLDGADKAVPCAAQVEVDRCFAPLLRWVLGW